MAAFNKATAELLFGADNPVIKQQRVSESLDAPEYLKEMITYLILIISKHKNPCTFLPQVATVQGLSGTGSLRLAAALIERYFPGAKVVISSPTWGACFHHLNLYVKLSQG